MPTDHDQGFSGQWKIPEQRPFATWGQPMLDPVPPAALDQEVEPWQCPVLAPGYRGPWFIGAQAEVVPYHWGVPSVGGRG